MQITKIYCLIITLLFLSITVQSSAGIVKISQMDWSEDNRLTFTDGHSVGPDFALEGDNIHIVYNDNESRYKYHRSIWYINSSDNGRTWNSPVCIIDDQNAHSPKIAAYGNNLHVIWIEWGEARVYYTRSTDNGKSWSSAKVLTPYLSHYSSIYDIAVYKNKIHIVYIDSYRKLTYINSYDNGVNWSSPKVLLPTMNVGGESIIAVNENNVHITVMVSRSILYMKSSDSGANWSNEVDLVSIPGIDPYPNYHDMTVAENDIYAIYRDYRPEGIKQIFYSHSDDNGITWKKRIQLSNSSYKSYVAPVISSAITAEGYNVWAIWEDRRNTTDGDVEFYYRYSSNRGDTWSDEIRLTNALGQTAMPDIQAREGKAHLVWGDDRDGNFEIYYKHGMVKSSIPALVDINPDTINLKSKGRWITCYITLDEPYDPNDIDISTILLEDTIPAEWGDIQGDKLMVKFDRSDVQALLPLGTYNLKVTGELADGTMFKGYGDEIRIVDHGK